MGVLAEKVPQISQMYTDLRDLFGLGKVTQIAQMTQIFLLLFLSADETYSVRFTQTFTITSSRLYVWVGVKGVYKNFCIYIVRKR